MLQAWHLYCSEQLAVAWVAVTPDGQSQWVALMLLPGPVSKNILGICPSTGVTSVTCSLTVAVQDLHLVLNVASVITALWPQQHGTLRFVGVVCSLATASCCSEPLLHPLLGPVHYKSPHAAVSHANSLDRVDLPFEVGEVLHKPCSPALCMLFAGRPCSHNAARRQQRTILHEGAMLLSFLHLRVFQRGQNVLAGPRVCTGGQAPEGPNPGLGSPDNMPFSILRVTSVKTRPHV